MFGWTWHAFEIRQFDVTKAHDAYNSDALYTVHTTPYQAAFRYLKEMAPLEPEMWLSLAKKNSLDTSSVKTILRPLT